MKVLAQRNDEISFRNSNSDLCVVNGGICDEETQGKIDRNRREDSQRILADPTTISSNSENTHNHHEHEIVNVSKIVCFLIKSRWTDILKAQHGLIEMQN